MSYSDDYAPTFSNGEGSGDFLESPDMVRQSPTTAERVVDTQSGFLVVVKRVDSRNSLSVKRRLGTPPASSILLTPDESIKLSRILGSSSETRTSSRKNRNSKQPTQETSFDNTYDASRDNVFDSPSRGNVFDSPSHSGFEPPPYVPPRNVFSTPPSSVFDTINNNDYDASAADLFDSLQRNNYDTEAQRSAFESAYRNTFDVSQRIPLEETDFDSRSTGGEDLDEDGNSRSYRAQRRARGSRQNQSFLHSPKNLILTSIACLILIPAVAVGTYKVLTARHAPKAETVAATSAPVVDVEAAKTERVNKFARQFVSDMLDFAPSTYRVSQVHAMANMSPELMEKYWDETHFPLSTSQLKTSTSTLMITKVDQERVDELTRNVDIYAELVSATNTMSNQVHLQLKIASSTDGQLRVLEQKDLSAKK